MVAVIAETKKIMKSKDRISVIPECCDFSFDFKKAYRQTAPQPMNRQAVE